MNKEDKIKAVETVKQILVSHGIEMTVQGCGCCGSPEVFFQYNGEIIVNNEENFNID